MALVITLRVGHQNRADIKTSQAGKGLTGWYRWASCLCGRFDHGACYMVHSFMMRSVAHKLPGCKRDTCEHSPSVSHTPRPTRRMVAHRRSLPSVA